MYFPLIGLIWNKIGCYVAEIQTYLEWKLNISY